jgi:hypothetical protein
MGTHPYLPGTVFHGHTSFDWIEGGAFIIMHSEIDETGIPSAIAVFGSDDSTGEYFILYLGKGFDTNVHSNKVKKTNVDSFKYTHKC